ncbi:hypothetical protein DEFDS_P077 (plasmid) [Deferribacter desulfuricans SSM1]|uniref:Uncharacterized protein n=1 Tax=Deferribacter desulfuricans (strain DSM 14783 / JCM 11476 / NBRC 101012 / SSM1) TaxID=639282 RepID=D3PEQ9_DEFDS|nr:hypothetical protein [Deferribacter desulfuricans]BAI81701.1 hypothetical protein DEFDS_P077 [Deferribacter desulfuricans SSM1]
MKKLLVIFGLTTFLLVNNLFSVSYATENKTKTSEKPYYIIFDKNFIEHSLKGLTGCKILKVGKGDVSSYGITDFEYMSSTVDRKKGLPVKLYKFITNSLEIEKKYVQKRGYNALIVQDVEYVYGFDTNDSMSIINGKVGSRSLAVAVVYVDALIKCRN